MAPTPLTKSLKFEKKNQLMPKLPKHAKIQKRPIPHPATASPYSGPSSPKTLYVSSSSPTMSVIKRVQKYLRVAENRATANLLKGGGGKKGGKGNVDALLARGAGGEDGEGLGLGKEEVLVKATGRAMERALKAEGEAEGEGEGEKKKKKEEEEGEEGQGDKVDGEGGLSKSAAKKRKKKAAAAAAAAAAEETEVPETRTRWVNMVEVGISLR
ncbi:hypothetical protein BO70DRAFT_410666 [Aspergillus heteromorphus CBS 117.55]|uniref:Uncharacterized protein n=1 Tax=Aspergillus heteromorphus CBS 117.55 TaxID=1448321 RepID=A0A317X0C1_9EURO|nr:uncharacterized protein BO70DRAFT_410666 [Aspergillus heteromorphus CBS 117.55]PWY91022.1 hypothetical protein BO70DRAFT_410666 [Aspergillus heteromorphus CBS 117.55]